MCFYGRYELILRYGFLAVTVFVAAVYIGQMTKLSGQMWGYQQKWIVLLLLFLVLFDGPLAYPRIYTVSVGKTRNKRHATKASSLRLASC